MRAWIVFVVIAGCLAPAAPPPTPDVPGPEPYLAPALVEAAKFGGGFSDVDVFAGTYDTSWNLSRVLRKGPHAIGEPEVVLLESAADGEAIEIGLTLPLVPDGTRVPVLVVASPYFVPLTPARMKGDEKLTGALPHTWLHWQFFAQNYVPHGYAVALVSVRGTAGSGGCMDLFGPLEQGDLDQAVTWLGTREWSSGSVAMIGLSYSAATPWEVAAAGNPHLKTIVPMAGINDFFHFLTYNGTVHSGSHGGFPLTYWPFAWIWDDPTAGGDAAALAAGAACPLLPESFAAPSLSATTLAPDPFGFFEERAFRERVEANWNGSVFLVHGLEDWRVPAKDDYPWMFDLEAKGFVVKHLLGQWPHTFPDSKAAGEHRRWDFAEILLRWFDFWLKEDRSVDLGPRVQVEDSEGRWRSESSWPPRDARATTFHLGAGGKLVAKAADAKTDAPLALYDPAHVSTPIDPILSNEGLGSLSLPIPCASCPSFSTDPLTAPLLITGLPVVSLTLTPTGPGGHVTVHLLAGDRVIGRGMLDLRLARGGEPEPLTPGAPVVARVLLEPLEAVVPAGQRLTLVVHQGGYEERMGPVPSWPVRLSVGGKASSMTMLTIERAEGDFFEPPRES